MCGINMILDFSGTVQAEHIQQMMGAVKHRGPDAESYVEKPFAKGMVFLGSNRLKIIDKDDNSNQPFVSKDGRFGLVFNGEIYNYEDLRNQLLSLGVEFSTRSDTEVLLYWLIQKGQKGVADLNGMFAFVLVDFKKAEVLVARDRLGIKPLFVHQSDKQLMFSSELHGILDSGLVLKKLNEDAIPHYLAYKYAPRPATFYKGIEEFMPGRIWQINQRGPVEKSNIQSPLRETLIGRKKQDVTAPISELLIDSVVQQYSQANNTGIMLSGGVDSTLLLAILNKELGYRNIPVFSIATKEKNKFATQDGSFALKAAKLYQAEYNEIGIDESSFDLLDEYIPTLGQPIADSGGFLTWLIARKAIGKSKTLLSGAGADELFAGYNRHIAFYKYLNLRDKSWFDLISHGKNLLAISTSISQFKKFANSIGSDPSTTFNNFIQSDTFRLTNNLWDNSLSNESHIRKALEHDQLNYLGADVLAITDYATMQYSIETRVPYLDDKLLHATRNLSANNLLKNGSKWMLKEQLVKYGGKQFAHRKKQGLGLPMDDWFRQNNHWFDFNKKEDHIHQFVSKQKVNHLQQSHNSGKENLTQELWRILLLHRWLNHNFT